MKSIKNQIKILTLVLVFTHLTNAQAQSISYSSGISMSSLKLIATSDDLIMNFTQSSKNLVSYSNSVSYIFPSKKKFGLSIGLDYIQKGDKNVAGIYNIPKDEFSLYSSIYLQYLSLNSIYNFKSGITKKVFYTLEIGPRFDC